MKPEEIKQKVSVWADGWDDIGTRTTALNEMKEVAGKKEYSVSDLKELINLELKKRSEKVKGAEERLKKAEFYSTEDQKERRDRILKTTYKALIEYPEEDRARVAKELSDKHNFENDWRKEQELERQRDQEGLQQFKKIFRRNKQAEVFSEAQPIFYDKAGMWWLWNRSMKKWSRVDEIDILNMIEEETGEDVVSSKNRTEILNSLKQQGRKRIPKEVKPTWIQFKDKILDIETGEEFDATPDFFVTNPIPHELHKEKFRETPEIDKIFEEWVGKKYVRTLYEIMAYCLLPDYPIHRIFCFYGAGMNGKSKYLELVRKFIGNENCCSTELDSLITSRFEVTRLHKKLVCQLGETNFNEMDKTSKLKQLSGGDLIPFEYKRADLFEDKNYSKIIISTNNLPTTTDKTIGFYRRWLIIDFPNQFSEKKDILGDIPEEEFECLTVKCAMILKDLLENRQFTNEGSVEDRMKKYEEKSNPLQKFWDEEVSEDHDGHIFKYDFKEKLNGWCKENRFREISDRSIAKFMKENHIETHQILADWYTKEGKKPTIRAWTGIKWGNSQV